MTPTVLVIRRSQENWMEHEIAKVREKDRLIDMHREYGREEGFKLGVLVGLFVGVAIGFMTGRATHG